MVREDRKWYENVKAVADAIEKASRDGYSAGYQRGLNDGVPGGRQRHAISIISDDYAPPVGPLHVKLDEKADLASLYFVDRGQVVAQITGLAIPHDFEPVPQPDGDGRFPNEAE